MKNFLAGLWMLILLFSIGCAGSLFYHNDYLWGTVVSIVTVVNLIAYFANKSLPTVDDITKS